MSYVGNIFTTNHYGSLIITNYVNNCEVYVKFIDTGYETKTRLGDIRNGKVKDRLVPSVCGVGVIGNETTKVNGKALKEYQLWHNMLERCYCDKMHKINPSYKDCYTSENFNYYPYFKDWCSKQIGFNSKGWALDKDILVKGNKVYSENTCCFVPHDINLMFTKRESKRGEHPIGVYYSSDRNGFIAMLSITNKRKGLGTYSTPEEAFQSYKQAKEDYIKDVANKWKDQIDPRAYEALMNYQVEITD